jgi:hypothetical protein
MDNTKIPGYAQQKTQAMRDYLSSSVDLTADPRFVETYKAILGSSFDKPEMQALWKRTIQKQLQTTQQADMLNDDVIRNILENMRIANPEALDTAAIAGRPKLRPSAKDVDVEGAKIAMAISGAKAARLDEVAKSLDVLTGAKVVVSEKKYAELGLTKEQAIQLIQIRSQRLLQGTSRGGAAQYMEDWKRITGKDYVDPRPGKKPRGIVQFMSDEFGQESIDLRNYIRYHEQNYIDRGYSVEDAANIIKEQGIPIIFDEQNAKALEKLAPEAFSGVKTAIGRAGLEESIAANIAPLRRASPDVYRYAMDMFDFFIAPRKRIAADNLGGLGLPNPLYHTTNYLSAPIIASVTDPTYIATIIEQQARGLGMAPLASAAKGTFRVNPSVAKDVEMGAVGLQRFISRESMGVQYIGNYTLDEAIYLYRTQNLGQTQTSLQFSTDLVQNVRNQAKTLGPKIGNAALAETLAPGLQAGPWMEIADQTNRMFREAVFFEALSRGHTGEEAAKLARDVLLDFSSMPFAAQEGLGAWVLYSAFTYSLTAELALALTKPKSMAKVTAIANYHRKLSEAMAQSQQTDVRSMVAYQQIDSVYDDQARVYKTYFENPIIDAMSDAINVVENFRLGYVVSQDLLEQAATEAQTMPAGISPETLNLFYDPVLRAFDELSEDNSSVPTSTVYWMSTDQYYGFMSGMQVMEFFDMDYVPLTERKPGVAEVGVDRYAIVDPQTGMITYQTEPLSIEQLEQQKRGGYQIKFKSNEGRQKFIKYNQMLQMTGYNRMMNDITNTLIMSGYLPEGTTFGYTEKGNPVWYNLAGEKIVRIPPEWEKRDRQIKMYESEYKKMLGEFNK